MENELEIENIEAVEVLDSRGNPTIEVKVKTSFGDIAKAIVPSGASTGRYEVMELRDGDKSRYNGKGVEKAVENVNKIIKNELVGMDIYDQRKIDKRLIEIDGTINKSRLGANAILGVSLAVAKVAAKSLDMELYRYIGGIYGEKMPVPMMNIINGGKHADNNINIQEFMILPKGKIKFKDKMEIATDVYRELKKVLKESGKSTGVGDEGGFAPDLDGDEDAIKAILEAIGRSGHRAGEDVEIALDVAATEMYEEAKKIKEGGKYYFWKTRKLKTVDDMIEYYDDICRRYPSIVSIEDALAEDDFDGWKSITNELKNKIKLVGDDLFVTNKERLLEGIEKNMANSILIKPNQIGTLTETLDTIRLAKENGYETIISHRSGETEDQTIADLAVGLNIEKVKFGAPCRTDRICKYNRLLEIENDLLTHN